jgi:hypothetical protein
VSTTLLEQVLQVLLAMLRNSLLESITPGSETFAFESVFTGAIKTTEEFLTSVVDIGEANLTGVNEQAMSIISLSSDLAVSMSVAKPIRY